MTTIYLHGALKKRYAASYTLDGRDIAECIRGLCAQLQGFRDYLEGGRFRVLRDETDIDSDLSTSLRLGLGTDDVHIIPVSGPAKKGVGKFLLGAALVVGAFFLPVGAATMAGLGTFSTIGNGIATIGMSIALTGVSQVLSPKPVMAQDTGDRKESYVYRGQSNQNAQGGAIPINHGEMIVGSVVASVGVTLEDVTATIDTTGWVTA